MTRDPKKVLIAMAVGNGMTRWETSMSLLRLMFARLAGYEFEFIPGGGCDVAHARNLMIHYWRTRSTAGLLLFIDSDVVFSEKHVEKILSWFDDPEMLYLGGIYPAKNMALRWSYGGWSKPSEIRPGLWEVFELCTGFTCLRWWLIDVMVSYFPETAYEIEDEEYRGETGYELCAMGPQTCEWADGRTYSRRLSEDFCLSMRAREMKVPIFVDPSIQLGHVGSFDFMNLHREKTKAPHEEEPRTVSPKVLRE